MKKPNPFLYGVTWWGIAHFLVVVLLALAALFLWQSAEPVPLKIIISLLIVLASGDILLKGTDHIRDGINLAHDRSRNRS